MAFRHFLTLFEFLLFFSLVFKVHSLKTCGDMLLRMMCLGDDFSHELNQEQHAVVANQFLTLGIKLFVATRHEFLQLSTINHTGSEAPKNFNANVDIIENKERTLQFICQNARENIDTSLIITELSMVCRKDEPIYGLSLVMEQLWTLPLLTETSEHQVLCPPLQVENLLEYELVIFQRCMELANSCTSYVLAFERKISSRIERVCISILNRV